MSVLDVINKIEKEQQADKQFKTLAKMYGSRDSIQESIDAYEHPETAPPAPQPTALSNRLDQIAGIATDEIVNNPGGGRLVAAKVQQSSPAEILSAQPKKDFSLAGAAGAIKDIGSGLVTQVIPDVGVSMARLLDDPNTRSGVLDPYIEAGAKRQEEYANAPGKDDVAIPFTDITRGELRSGVSSLGFSGASMLGSMLVGKAGKAAGAAVGELVDPAGGGIPGGAIGQKLGEALGGGLVGYKLDKHQFTQQYRNFLEQKLGHKMTDKEWNTYRAGDVADHINKHALHEAGWEGLGNAVSLGIFNKIKGKSLGKRALKGLAEFFWVELAGETQTQTGQTNEEVALGMQPKENKRSFLSLSDQAKSAREVLPATMLMAGVASGGKYTYEKGVSAMKGKRESQGLERNRAALALKEKNLPTSELEAIRSDPAKQQEHGVTPEAVDAVIRERADGVAMAHQILSSVPDPGPLTRTAQQSTTQELSQPGIQRELAKTIFDRQAERNPEAQPEETVSPDDVQAAQDLVDNLNNAIGQGIDKDTLVPHVQNILEDKNTSEEAKKIILESGIPDQLGMTRQEEQSAGPLQKEWDAQAKKAQEYNRLKNTPPREMTPEEQAFMQEYEKGNESASMYPGGPPAPVEQVSDEEAKKHEEAVNRYRWKQRMAAISRRQEQEEKKNENILASPGIPDEVKKQAESTAQEIVNADPVYSQMAEAKKRGGLNLSAFKADYDTDTVNMIQKRYPGIFSKAGKIDPDEFAAENGYESMTEMVDRFGSAKTKKELQASIVEDLHRQWQEAESQQAKDLGDYFGRQADAGTFYGNTYQEKKSNIPTYPASESEVADLEKYIKDTAGRFSNEQLNSIADDWRFTSDQRARITNAIRQGVIQKKIAESSAKGGQQFSPASEQAKGIAANLKQKGAVSEQAQKEQQTGKTQTTPEESSAAPREVSETGQFTIEPVGKAGGILVKGDSAAIIAKLKEAGHTFKGRAHKEGRAFTAKKADVINSLFGQAKTTPQKSGDASTPAGPSSTGGVVSENDKVEPTTEKEWFNAIKKKYDKARKLLTTQINTNTEKSQNDYFAAEKEHAAIVKKYNEWKAKQPKADSPRVKTVTTPGAPDAIPTHAVLFPDASPGDLLVADREVYLVKKGIKTKREAEKLAGETGGRVVLDRKKWAVVSDNKPTPASSIKTESSYGKSNKLFTEDAAAKARELLKSKLNQLNTGLDPEMMQAGITLAGYHIEAGARAFADYSKAMVNDLGEEIKPFLRSFYEGVRYYPGMDNSGMSTPEEIDKIDAPERRKVILNKGDKVKFKSPNIDYRGFLVGTIEKVHGDHAAYNVRGDNGLTYNMFPNDPKSGDVIELLPQEPETAAEKEVRVAKNAMLRARTAVKNKPTPKNKQRLAAAEKRLRDARKNPALFEDEQAAKEITKESFARDLKNKGVATDRNGTTFKIISDDNTYYFTETDKDGIRVEHGPGYPASWSMATAREKATQRASFQNIEKKEKFKIGDFVEPVRDKDVLKAGRIEHITSDGDIRVDGSSGHFPANDYRKVNGVSTDEITSQATISTPEKVIAGRVTNALSNDERITYAKLVKWANEAYGGKQSEGKYSVKDAYDALELGINKYIEKMAGFNPGTDIFSPRQTIGIIKDKIMRRIPTQTKRTAEMDEFQQFSTPPPLAYMANWVAKPQEGETYLEPSAGVGGIAVFGKNAGAKVVVNELSKRRRKFIKELGFDKVLGENAEHLNSVISADVKPSVIVMNPPFSATAGRVSGKRATKIGAAHVEQALKKLQPGGRLVAIVGKGMSDDSRSFVGWWDGIKKEYNVRANIQVSGKGYRKYGTTFDNQILVIDKTGPTTDSVITGKVESPVDLVPLLEDIRNDRKIVQPDSSKQEGKSPAGEGKGTGGISDTGSVVSASTNAVGPVKGTTGEGAGNIQGLAGDTVATGGSNQGGGVRGNGRPDRGGSPGTSIGQQETAGSSVGTPGPVGNSNKGSTGPGATTTPENVPGKLSIDRQASKNYSDVEISSSVYEDYRPEKVKIKGAKKHPAKLAQSAAMASVSMPDPDYSPRLPKKTIESGALSEVQLESIVYAGQAHSKKLPDGTRQGFFIGDGTGIGKGREVAGILFDNWNNGRRKAVWISETQNLFKDAKRDIEGIGWEPGVLRQHSKTKATDTIPKGDGVLYTTYNTLKSAAKGEGGAEGKTRLDQIVEWLGEDFDGVLAFDESHNMGNAVAMKGKRGMTKPSLKALAGVELQRMLPRARVVYLSATGATEISNLSYAERLGLWGEGTAFPNKISFINQISAGGTAAMELIARDMKAMGVYLARTISYDGVAYDRIEHKLIKEQHKSYNQIARAWQVVLNHIDEALEITDADSKGKSRAKAAFWGANQRFFNQLVTIMQMPAVIKNIHTDLDNGDSVVIQLTNTFEAATERGLAKLEEGMSIEDLDISPFDDLMMMVEKSFPVAQYEEYSDEDGNIKKRPALDSEGNQIINAEAVAKREALLDELGSIRGTVADNPLDQILDEFGVDNVAEVTGRKRRIVWVKEGGARKKVIQKRNKASGKADTQDFMDDKKRILIFSQAGGTGSSYHADNTAANTRMRQHYLLQPGWRADQAVQGLGRTHRSNQKQPPKYRLVTTDLKGQKRFLSSIARRLEQLGALTKGQRQTGNQGIFSERDNLESSYAKDALRKFFRDLASGGIDGITIDSFSEKTGLKLIDEETGQLRTDLPEVTQFLNRLLSVEVDEQNRLFDAFSRRIDEVIAAHAAAGTLDVGLETLTAESVKKESEQIVNEDERTGAETKYVILDTEVRNARLSFKDSKQYAEQGYYQNKASGKVWAATRRMVTNRRTGSVRNAMSLTSPAYRRQNIDLADFSLDKWTHLSPDAAEREWNASLDSMPKTRHQERHLITGALLPIWDRLGGNPRIMRVQTDEGERMIGRLIDTDDLEGTISSLGVDAKTGGRTSIEMAPSDVFDSVLNGGDEITLANGTRIIRRKVSGEWRVEVANIDPAAVENMKKYGMFSERINWKTRYFIPTGSSGITVIEKLLVRNPVVQAGSGAQFSKSFTALPSSQRADIKAELEGAYKKSGLRNLLRQGVKIISPGEAENTLSNRLGAKFSMSLLHGSGTAGIDKFSIGKAGSSDGTAFGYGIYLTDSKAVARYYAEHESGKRDGTGMAPKRKPGSRNIYKAEVSGRDFVDWEYITPAQKEKLIKQAKKTNPDIADALKLLLEAYEDGGNAYRNTSYLLGGDAEASTFFREAGIDGIKYPVATLTGIPGQKGTNYVIFDEDAIKISDSIRYSKDGRIEAFTLPDGTVHLVQGNIKQGESTKVLAHELGVHAKQLGFKESKDFQGILNLLKRRAAKDKDIQAAYNRVPDDTPDHLRDEEALAYLVSAAPEHNLVTRLIAAIKRFLVEHGISERILSKTDLQALAQSVVAGIAKKQGAVNQSPKTNPDIRYSKSKKTKEDTLKYKQAITSTENLNAEIGGVKSTTSEEKGQSIIFEILRQLRESGVAGPKEKFSESKANDLAGKFHEVVRVLNDPHKSIAEKQKFAAGFAQKLPAAPRAKLLQKLSQISRYKGERAQRRHLLLFLDMAERVVTQHLRRELIDRVESRIKPTKANQGLRKGPGMDVARGRGPKLERDLKYLRNTAIGLSNENKVRQEVERLQGRIQNLEDRIAWAENDKVKARLREKLEDAESQIYIAELFGGLAGRGVDDLIRARKALDYIFENGTAEWRANQEFWRNRNQVNREAATRDITGQDNPKPETVAQESKRIAKEGKLIGKAKEGLNAISNSIQSWEFMLDKISGRSGKGTLKSWLVDHFGSVVHKATRDYERMNLDTHDALQKKAMEIFGVKNEHQLAKAFARANVKVEGKVFTYLGKKEKLTISPLEAAYWYQISKDATNQVMQKTFEKMGITDKTMRQIEKLMGPKVKAWADYLVDEFYQDFHDDVNEVYRKVYGIDLEKNKNYVPWRRKVTGRAADKQIEGFLAGISAGTIKKGSLRVRVENYLPFRQMNINSVLMSHVADMNHFKAWAIPAREINGTFNDPKVQGYIRQYYGASSLRAIRRFQDDFMKSERDMRDDMDWLDKWRGRITTSLIGANPTIFLKQLTSIPAYATAIPAGAWARYTAYALAHPVSVAKILGQSTMMQARYKKGFERDVANAMRRSSNDMIAHGREIPAKLMALTALGDKMAIVAGGYAVYRYNYLQNMKKAGYTKERAHKEALVAFEKATERSQQAGNVKDLGSFQRGGPVMKLFTMFMTAPASYSRQIFAAVRNMKADPVDSAKRLFIYGVVLPSLFQAVADAFMIVGGDDDDKERFWKNQVKAIALGPFNGLPIIRDFAKGVENAAAGDYWMMMMTSYSPVIDALKSPFPAIYHGVKGVKNNDTDLMFKALKDAGEVAGYLTGLPVKPAERIFTGIRDSATGKTKHQVRRSIGYSKYVTGDN